MTDADATRVTAVFTHECVREAIGIEADGMVFHRGLAFTVWGEPWVIVRLLEDDTFLAEKLTR